jgi:hypothetical protein
MTWYFFGAYLFRWAVSYELVGEKRVYEVKDKKLIGLIEQELKDSSLTAYDILIHAEEITSAHLHFTFDKCDVDPNDLVNSKSANCVGYAAFTAGVANYLLEKNKLSRFHRAVPLKGKVYLFGFNVHQLFSSPFFRDHDFIMLENTKSGETYYADPTVHDYLGVDFVRLKE